MIYDIFEKLDPKKHNRKDFDCGVGALNLYLQRQARQDQDKGYSVSWVLLDADSSQRIVAYYTLSNSAVMLNEFTDEERNALKLTKNPTVPCTLLGRFAVDIEYQGQGVGFVVLYAALQKALELSDSSGSVFVVIDAKDEKVRNWYVNKFGFIPLSGNPLRVYQPMKTLKKLFE